MNISDLPRAQANEALRLRAAAQRATFDQHRAARVRTIEQRLTVAIGILMVVVAIWIIGRGLAWLIPLILSPEASTAPAPPAVSIPVGAFEARAGQPFRAL